MPTTRLQAGETPKKTERPGFIATPRRRRNRKSKARQVSSSESDEREQSPDAHNTPKATANVNGKPNGHLKTTKGVKNSGNADIDARVEEIERLEFGGPWGVGAIMIGFPFLMYYMWIGATYYDGHFPLPAEGESFPDFAQHLVNLVYEGAFPSIKAWAMYWVFFLFEAACYLYLPGVYAHGKPLKHEGGKSLTYYCSGQWSFYTTILVMALLHFTGIFKIYTILDEFGPLLSVAILSGCIVSAVAYASALHRGVEHRMTGSHVYDFFMGAELNPRMFGILDFKMFFEVRLPWFILLMISAATAARQYEAFGWVSGEVAFLVMAHFLYANACAKGEEMIVTTWDMYYEKWGFMLIFWNLAGVPLSYCHCSLYLANHAPSVYKWNRWALVLLYISYLFVYWVWDTANSQKNRFRQAERGTLQDRTAFPQLPWKEVANPNVIKTETGDSILVDGWFAHARKIHYTADLFFALTWGFITGFNSPFPWFYPVFFTCMISHRAWRDTQKCRARYGKAWEEYERRVPYLFIPIPGGYALLDSTFGRIAVLLFQKYHTAWKNNDEQT
ncbi:delta(24(24(1)))-sterol reductase [Physcia stellaris]|nr:delta(24(24(1)))-sterol reductase [Physcia stellaris]